MRPVGPLLLLVLVASCEKAATGGPPLRDVTPERFGQMRWLAGTWRGTAIRGGEVIGAPFYEVWRAADDSTLVMHRFDDSTLARPRDSVRVELRGGAVYYRSDRPLMSATGIASRAAVFFPEGASRGGVTFNTQAPCSDTLAPATAACHTGAGAPTVMTRFWWGALWHTAPVVAGIELREGDHFAYNPARIGGR